MTQGDRVKHLRKELGKTLEKFGEPLGVGKTAISNIENNNRNLTDQMIISICREYHVREEWLRYEDGDMFLDSSAEVGHYVEDLLEYDGHGNSLYDMIIEMMKSYQEMDEKSKQVVREYFQKVKEGLKKEGD